MSFSDPQTITIDGVAHDLAKIKSGETSSEFKYSPDGFSNVDLVISHQYAKRTRRVAKLTSDTLASDIFNPDGVIPVSMSISLVIDTPNYGIAVADQKNAVDALLAYLSASSGANVSQILLGSY